MNLIICLDEKNGMMFNKRRQSRDSVVIDKILELTKDSTLWMSCYSEKLFPEEAGMIVDDEHLTETPDGDFCFAETTIKSLHNVETLYIFYWNRRYPADVHFTFDLEQEGFALNSTEEFAGNSHEKITLCVYCRA